VSAELRAQVVAAARRLAGLGLAQGKSGNVSARWGEGFLVTPSGRAYESMEPADLAHVDASGASRGPHSPSSEWRLHLGIYAHRPEAQAIVHTHSPFATTLACLDRGIPAFHYEVAQLGGRDIRCCGYATFGTQELSDLAVAALEGRRACLMSHHGVVAFGADVEEALTLAGKVEVLARMYWQALQVGEPSLLGDAEMERVARKFLTYGK